MYHGIGTSETWKKLTRDLIVDLQKGLNYLDKDKSKHKIPRSKLKIINITLRGGGSLDNLTLSSSEHIQQFYDAAEWFVRNQNQKTGGWEIPVKRKLAIGTKPLKYQSQLYNHNYFRFPRFTTGLVLFNGTGPCNISFSSGVPSLGRRQTIFERRPRWPQTFSCTEQ